LREDEIVKSKGTPDFVTPIGGFEVKKLYGDKIIFYSNQLEELSRFPDVKILIFNGTGEFVKEASYADIDLNHGKLWDFKVINSEITSIQISRYVKERLQALGRMHDTYSTIIERLLDGSKGDAHEDRRAARDEPVGDSGQETG